MKGWFLSASHVCACVILLVACGGEEAAETGSNVVASCTDLAKEGCPPGTSARLDADAVAECGASVSGSVTFTDQSGELSGQCKSEGDCSFACVPPAACCGGEEWTDTSYKCDLPCAGVDTCSCEDRCGVIQDGDCDVDCGTCPVGKVCSDEGICEVGCAEGAVLCAGSCCGSGEVCYLNLCCDAVANCAGKECGSDQCGSLCEIQESIPGCAENQTCDNGTCSQTCLLGDQKCFSTGGQTKIQTCQLNDGLLGWYVTGTCVGDTPNCMLSNLGAVCVPCSKDAHCGLGQTCSPDGLCTGECQPQCTDVVCGDDQCDGSCGECEEADAVCIGGACVVGCEPQCADKECGDDGCAGTCGEDCAEGDLCLEPAGTCCDNSCEGVQCGDNGCGSSCGGCDGGTACTDGKCTCVPDCEDSVCDDNGCGDACGICPPETSDCDEGQCVCSASCAALGGGIKECGSDGCDGSCGTCEASGGLECQYDTGECVSNCSPSCAGKECGDDGCGGSCGTCPDSNEACNAMGQCYELCTSGCTSNSECGPDGCGGTCGQCEEEQECTIAGTNSNDPWVCVDPELPCGSVNLIEEGSGDARLALPESFDEIFPEAIDSLAFGVWIKGPEGDSTVFNRVVVATPGGLEIKFLPKTGGTKASFRGKMPLANGEVVEFTPDEDVPSYGSWWKTGGLGYPWVMVGFVRSVAGVSWCAQHTVTASPVGQTTDSAPMEPVYLDQVFGAMEQSDGSWDVGRVGQSMIDSFPLRARVGGVRIYGAEADLAVDPDQACSTLFTDMQNPADASGEPGESGWMVLQSWSLNTWPGVDQQSAPAGAFVSDQGELLLSLMDENEWSEQENFSPGTCPVAY
jgi:hypothetical protein